MLYCLKKHKKLCLPFIIFEYLKELINKSRITAGNKKVLNYIPFGRLLSDILVESGIVDALRDAQCTEDLTTSVGDVLDARNLKKMGVLEKITVYPIPEADEVVLDRRLMEDDFPPFSKEEPLEAIMEYIRMQVDDRYDMSWFTYDMLPDTIEEMDAGKKRRKKSSEGDDSEKERMKATKKQKKEDKKKQEKKKQRKIHL